MKEELGIPYKLEKFERTPAYFAPPELKKVHPIGLAPIITDGDITIAESGAIVGMSLSWFSLAARLRMYMH